MKNFRYLGCVYLCFIHLLHCTVYATATPAPSSHYKDIYLEAPGSDIDVTIPLLGRRSDSLRTYVKVTPSKKSTLGTFGNKIPTVEERMEKSDSRADKRFFLKNNPRLPPHPPTRHRPPIHPPRPHHGPRKYPRRPHHGPPPPHPFEYNPHFDHGSNNIFEPAHGFDFEPPYFMNEESDFPYAEEFFEDQHFDPEPPKPDSFTFPSDEYDGPSHPHPPPYPPHHSSSHFPHVPDHINFITEESIYRGDVPFKETHNDRDMIHPGLTPAGVKGLDPGLVAFINEAFINESARPFFK